MTGLWKTQQGMADVHARYRWFLDLWPVEKEELRVPTRQGETFVVASGPARAPALVLFHGSGSTSAVWIGDVAEWAKTFRVYAVDIIGEPGFSAPSRPDQASDAHALWLDDILAALGVERASFVGISLGGWLALDYATRRPERVAALVAVCPAGVGKPRNILLWALPLLMLGAWGRRKLSARIIGDQPSEAREGMALFSDFLSLTFQHYRPRTNAMPLFDDDALARLTMPVLAILGGKDELVDSEGVRERLQANAPCAEIEWLPEAGHVIVRQTGTIARFLRRAHERSSQRPSSLA